MKIEDPVTLSSLLINYDLSKLCLNYLYSVALLNYYMKNIYKLFDINYFKLKCFTFIDVCF